MCDAKSPTASSPSANCRGEGGSEIGSSSFSWSILGTNQVTYRQICHHSSYTISNIFYSFKIILSRQKVTNKTSSHVNWPLVETNKDWHAQGYSINDQNHPKQHHSTTWAKRALIGQFSDYYLPVGDDFKHALLLNKGESSQTPITKRIFY